MEFRPECPRTYHDEKVQFMPTSKKVLKNRVVRLLEKKPIAPTKVPATTYIAHELKIISDNNIKPLLGEILEELSEEKKVHLEYYPGGTSIQSVELIGIQLEDVKLHSDSKEIPNKPAPRRSVPATRPTPRPRAARTPTPKETPVSTPTPASTQAPASPTTEPTPGLSPVEMLEQLVRKGEDLTRQMADMKRTHADEVRQLEADKTRLSNEKSDLVAKLRDAEAENKQLVKATGELTTALGESDGKVTSLTAELTQAKEASGSLDALAMRVTSLLGNSTAS